MTCFLIRMRKRAENESEWKKKCLVLPVISLEIDKIGNNSHLLIDMFHWFNCFLSVRVTERENRRRYFLAHPLISDLRLESVERSISLRHQTHRHISPYRKLWFASIWTDHHVRKEERASEQMLRCWWCRGDSPPAFSLSLSHSTCRKTAWTMMESIGFDHLNRFTNEKKDKWVLSRMSLNWWMTTERFFY